jgi:peroxiredoxin
MRTVRAQISTMLVVLFFTAGVMTAAAADKTATTKTKKAAVKPAQDEKPMAPDFALKGLDGKTVKLSDFKGKVVILDFWATWCPPCKAEIPGFIDLYKTYKDKGLVVIGAALDEEKKVRDFVKKYGVNYPVVLGDQETAQAYGGIRGIPTTFIIDRTGHIAGQHVGYREMEVFVKEFENLK